VGRTESAEPNGCRYLNGCRNISGDRWNYRREELAVETAASTANVLDAFKTQEITCSSSRVEFSPSIRISAINGKSSLRNVFEARGRFEAHMNVPAHPLLFDLAQEVTRR
jgi:hypothetical protein